MLSDSDNSTKKKRDDKEPQPRKSPFMCPNLEQEKKQLRDKQVDELRPRLAPAQNNPGPIEIRQDQRGYMQSLETADNPSGDEALVASRVEKLDVLVWVALQFSTEIEHQLKIQEDCRDDGRSDTYHQEQQRALGIKAGKIADEWKEDLRVQMRAIATLASEPGVQASSHLLVTHSFFGALKELRPLQLASDQTKETGPALLLLHQDLQKAKDEWKIAAAAWAPLIFKQAKGVETTWDEINRTEASNRTTQAFDDLGKIQDKMMRIKQQGATAQEREYQQCLKVLAVAFVNAAGVPASEANAVPQNAADQDAAAAQRSDQQPESQAERHHTGKSRTLSPSHNGRPPSGTHAKRNREEPNEPGPSLVNDLREAFKKRLREAKLGMQEAEEKFDRVREDYHHNLDVFQEDVAAGRYKGTQTEFGLQYFLQRRAANRELVLAEECYELAYEEALGVGALREDQRSSGFQDRSDDGYAESAYQYYIDETVDRPRIEKWLGDQVEEPQIESAGDSEPVDNGDRDRSRPLQVRENAFALKRRALSIGAESSFSQDRFAHGRRRKRIKMWQREQEETRRTIYET